MLIYFTLTLILYSIYASVPFWDVRPELLPYICPFFSLLGGVIWGTILKNTEKTNISQNGLIFDSIITISFFIVPVMLLKQNFSFTNVIGIGLIILGILILKGAFS